MTFAPHVVQDERYKKVEGMLYIDAWLHKQR